MSGVGGGNDLISSRQRRQTQEPSLPRYNIHVCQKKPSTDDDKSDTEFGWGCLIMTFENSVGSYPFQVAAKDTRPHQPNIFNVMQFSGKKLPK